MRTTPRRANWCGRCGFDNAFIFRYSRRRDTPAAAMPGQVDEAVKEARNQDLLGLVNEIARTRNEALVGRNRRDFVRRPQQDERRATHGAHPRRTRSSFSRGARATSGASSMYASRARRGSAFTGTLQSSNNSLPPMIYPHLDLRLVSLLCGLWLIFTHGFALLRPAPVQKWLRKLPRSKPAGGLLLIIDSIWALVLIATMDLGEFSHLRTILLAVILVATFLTFRFVDEFLAVRALGILMLLVAEPLIEAAFLKPETGRLLLVAWAYALAILGMVWVGLPYLMRDQIDWLRKSKAAWSAAAFGGLAFGGLLTAFAIIG